MRHIFTVLLLGFSMVLAAQSYGKVKVGKLAVTEFTTSKSYSRWYAPEYNSYVVDTAKAALLKKRLAGKQITIVMGIWCSDSRREVPRIIKVLKYLGFDLGKLTIYAVDKAKTNPHPVIAQLKIQYVPTTIVTSSGGAELGRMVESPVKTIEDDLLTITQE
jgi:hypothetical protein